MLLIPSRVSEFKLDNADTMTLSRLLSFREVGKEPRQHGHQLQDMKKQELVGVFQLLAFAVMEE